MTITDNNFLGIGYVIAAIFVFSTVNVIAKGAMADYSIIQVIFFRNVFAIIPAGLMLMREGGLKAMKTPQLPRHIIVGLSGVVALYCLFASLRDMPLAEAVTIHYSASFILTIMSAWILSEFIGIHRWSAIIIGFIGVVIMFRPTGDFFNAGALYALGFAIGDAFFMLNARILTRTDNSSAVVMYYVLICTVISGAMLPWTWTTPTLVDGLKLAILGLGAGFGQFFMAQGYKNAPARTVAPFIYSGLLWSIAYGYFIFGDVPDMNLLIGAGLIVTGGLYVIYREALHLRDNGAG
ncbi:MAG: DMT family transporter [Alphaproteobacteria bacterium]